MGLIDEQTGEARISLALLLIAAVLLLRLAADDVRALVRVILRR